MIPPLRAREGDLPLLLDHFLRVYCAANKKPLKQLQPEVIGIMEDYPWPGNVRELRNVVERLVLLATEDSITAEEVRMVLPGGEAASAGGNAETGQGTLLERTEAFEREVLLGEIRRHNFHMTNVARALGLERSHLYKKCQQLGIDLQSLRKPE